MKRKTLGIYVCAALTAGVAALKPHEAERKEIKQVHAMAEETELLQLSPDPHALYFSHGCDLSAQMKKHRNEILYTGEEDVSGPAGMK